MGALYEDVETFFGDIFACYGRFVSRFPHLFTICPLVFCLLLGLGLFSIKYETNIENLYSPINSQAQKDRLKILSIFDPGKLFEDFQKGPTKRSSVVIKNWGTHFKYHQKINQPTYFEVIVYSKKNKKDVSLNNRKKRTIQPPFNITVSKNEKPKLVCPWSNNSKNANIVESVLREDFNPTLSDQSSLSLNSIKAIKNLYKCIAMFQITKPYQYNYFDICSKFNNKCSVDIFEVERPSLTTCAYYPNNKENRNSTFFKFFQKTTPADYELYDSSNHFPETTTPHHINYTVNNASTVSKKQLPSLHISRSTKAIKIRFNLKEETRGEARQRHLRWQKALMNKMKKYKNPYIIASFMASDSLEIELQDYVGGDTKYFVFSVLAMLVSATVAGSSGNCDQVGWNSFQK